MRLASLRGVARRTIWAFVLTAAFLSYTGGLLAQQNSASNSLSTSLQTPDNADQISSGLGGDLAAGTGPSTGSAGSYPELAVASMHISRQAALGFSSGVPAVNLSVGLPISLEPKPRPQTETEASFTWRPVSVPKGDAGESTFVGGSQRYQAIRAPLWAASPANAGDVETARSMAPEQTLMPTSCLDRMDGCMSLTIPQVITPPRATVSADTTLGTRPQPFTSGIPVRRSAPSGTGSNTSETSAKERIDTGAATLHEGAATESFKNQK